MSDIHGDFETFDKALQAIRQIGNVDALAITGDLAGSGFNQEEAKYFSDAQENIVNFNRELRANRNAYGENLTKTCEYVLNDKNAPEDVKKLVKDYQELQQKDVQYSSNCYQEFASRLEQLSTSDGVRTLLVPGNWDSLNIDDYLAENNLHNRNGRKESIKGIGFVGYGGAGMVPRIKPYDKLVDFDEDEAYNHLTSNEDAEIALVHSPVAGLDLDGENSRHFGEYCLTAYMHRNTPSLILEGHSHKPRISKDLKSGTIVCNPGNLGKYDNGNHGSFLELDINDECFVAPRNIYHIKGDELYTTEIAA